tara:strand:+ start:433 stop:600 length:168 start_codon:yes stop_codon:yes gene_type:complete
MRNLAFEHPSIVLLEHHYIRQNYFGYFAWAFSIRKRYLELCYWFELQASTLMVQN